MKLTSILLLASLCLHLSPARGQSPRFSYGIQVQTRISDLVFHHPNLPGYEKAVRESATWRFSPGIAPWVRYQLNDRVGFQAGLGYELSGYRLKEFVVRTSTPQNPEPVRVGTAKGSVHYHDLNLSLGVRVKPFKNADRFYLTGGLSTLFNIGRYQTIVIYYDSGEVYEETEPMVRDEPGAINVVEPASANLRADIGFGFDWKAWGKTRWFAEPMFGFTLLPVLNLGDGKSRQYVTGINIGMAL